MSDTLLIMRMMTIMGSIGKHPAGWYVLERCMMGTRTWIQ